MIEFIIELWIFIFFVELNCVLGGGIVWGLFVLIGGDLGIGKFILFL